MGLDIDTGWIFPKFVTGELITPDSIRERDETEATADPPGGEGWELHWGTTAFGEWSWWEWIGVAPATVGRIEVVPGSFVHHDISFFPTINLGDFFGLLDHDITLDLDTWIFGTLLGGLVGYGIGFDLAVRAPVQGVLDAAIAHIVRTYGVSAAISAILPGDFSTIVTAGIGGFQVGSIVGSIEAPLDAWLDDIVRWGQWGYDWFREGVEDWTTEGHDLLVHDLLGF